MPKKKAEPNPKPHFEPEPYHLNWERLKDVPAAIFRIDRERKVTTVGAVLREVLPGYFYDPDAPEDREPSPLPEVVTGSAVLALEIKKASGESLWVDSTHGEGARFGRELVERVLELIRVEKEKGLRPVLFYYGHDRGDNQDTWWDQYKFFVVAGDAIVSDYFELSSLCDDKLDTDVLKPVDIGEGHNPGRDAWLSWWYRRFYTETRAGQLMVLRQDDSELYHYSPPERREVERDLHLRAISDRLARLEILLIVAAIAWLLRGWFAGR